MSKSNYMEKVDAWFKELVDRYVADGNDEAFKKAIKEKILESYRNGQRSVRRSPRESEATSEGK